MTFNCSKIRKFCCLCRNFNCYCYKTWL